MKRSEAEALYGRMNKTTLVKKDQWLNIWRKCEDAPEGDFVECGSFKGGVSSLLASYDRPLWMFDSWEGMPADQDTFYGRRSDDREGPRDKNVLPDCIQTLSRAGLLRDRLFFMKGWFKDTVDRYTGRIALLVLDGDFYSSTRECLTALYPKVVPGGYVVVDDLPLIPCRDAVMEYRETHGITAPMFDNRDEPLIWNTQLHGRAAGAWWRK